MKCFQAPRTVFPTPEGFAPQQVSNIFIMMFDISKPQNKKEIKTPTFQLSHLVASLQAAFLHRLEKFGLRGRELKLPCLKSPNLSPGHFRYHVHNFNVPVDSDIIRLGARGLAHREQRQTCNESDGSVSYEWHRTDTFKVFIAIFCAFADFVGNIQAHLCQITPLHSKRTK